MIELMENRWYVVMVGFRTRPEVFAAKPPHYLCYEVSQGLSAAWQTRSRLDVVSGPHDTRAEAEEAKAKTIAGVEQPSDLACATASLVMFGQRYRRCKATVLDSEGVADGYCGQAVCGGCKERDKADPASPTNKQDPLFVVTTKAMARRIKHNDGITDALCQRLAGRMTPRKLRRALLDGVAAGIKESDALRYADILGSKRCIVDTTLPDGMRLENAEKVLDETDDKVGFLAGSLSTRITEIANAARIRSAQSSV
jgi:hypothetical protein